jgi:RNA polymerase sigma-70 factor (ECF subfamily)
VYQGISGADAEWLRELYARYRHDVFGYIMGKVTNPAMAEDLASETFLRAAKNVDTLRGRGHEVLPWLFRVAHNLVLDDRKSSYARKRVLTDSLPELPVEQDRPEDQLIRKWLVDEVNRCAQGLNAAQRRCLQLRFVDGLSVQDTARLMNKSVLAVRQLQHRAIGRLGVLLAGTTAISDLVEAA